MQNPCNCFIKAKSLNILRDLILSVVFYSKFNTSGFFLKTLRFFFGKPNFSCKKPNFWKFWEIWMFCSHSTSNWLTVSVAVDIKLAKLSCLQNFRFHFRKNHRCFKNPKFQKNPTNWVNSAASLLPLAI